MPLTDFAANPAAPNVASGLVSVQAIDDKPT